ncbi:DUF2989 domain-containing protein [Pseudoalteromonas sp. MMG013]|uniref:DUF2989 domain-containing protein n=1 Tax=Pseudoalteromonas sp. MMG013 TaxID=2822687 RepID=UPI001B363BF9|nr:DUF2989 domain-containing protein [Pseudoalteromonas sp. MMG013]MBQ4862986.1 DUF2989 domain-containing protein [Pseudoalteromonas sp. MMG013]
MVLRQSLVLSTLLLVACDQPLTLSRVCKETPGFCTDLNKDSHCKDQRAEVTIARYIEYKDPTDDNAYQLLKLFEKYDECVSLAAKIEHIKLKEKTTSRVEGHLTSLKEMNRIYQDSLDTKHPGLLYYHWSRNNNQTAMNKLLKMEDSPKVTSDPEIQLFLASYYAKFDDEKTINLLYRVLELNKEGEKPNIEVYTSLTSLFFKQRKFKHAYIFSKVALMSGFEDIDILPVTHQITSRGQSLAPLDDLAAETFNNIQDGTFVSPREF